LRGDYHSAVRAFLQHQTSVFQAILRSDDAVSTHGEIATTASLRQTIERHRVQIARAEEDIARVFQNLCQVADSSASGHRILRAENDSIPLTMDALEASLKTIREMIGVVQDKEIQLTQMKNQLCLLNSSGTPDKDGSGLGTEPSASGSSSESLARENAFLRMCLMQRDEDIDGLMDTLRRYVDATTSASHPSTPGTSMPATPSSSVPTSPRGALPSTDPDMNSARLIEKYKQDMRLFKAKVLEERKALKIELYAKNQEIQNLRSSEAQYILEERQKSQHSEPGSPTDSRPQTPPQGEDPEAMSSSHLGPKEPKPEPEGPRRVRVWTDRDVLIVANLHGKLAKSRMQIEKLKRENQQLLCAPVADATDFRRQRLIVEFVELQRQHEHHEKRSRGLRSRMGKWLIGNYDCNLLITAWAGWREIVFRTIRGSGGRDHQTSPVGSIVL